MTDDQSPTREPGRLEPGRPTAGRRRAGRRAADPASATTASIATTAGTAPTHGRRAAGKKAKRTGWRRYVPSWKVVLFSFLGLFLLGAGGVYAAYAMTDIPKPNDLVNAQTSIVYYNDGTTELGRFAEQNRTSVDLSKVPEHVQHAVVAAEDKGFYENSGISPRGIARAFINNMKGESTQGGSTITQQYVKNYYLSQERTISRKIKEFFVSVKIDGQLDKTTIMQDYLNTIYFGRQAYGIEAASHAYFGKSVDQLTVEEGAAISAIIRSPGNYDPHLPENLPRLESRYRYVLEGMADKGWLDPAVAAAAPLPAFKEYVKTNQYQGTRGYLIQMVEAELKANNVDQTLIDTGGLRITSTFDPRLQDAAERAVAEEFPAEENEGVRAGLAAVTPGTGEVVAAYGGVDALTQPLNNATAGVAAGSTIKPFTLTAAVENGIGIKSRFAGNSPLKLDDTDQTEINNEFNEDYGKKVDLIKATAQSINTAFVDLTMKLGPQAVRDGIVKAGIPEGTKGLEAVPTITLGTANISAVNMANGYATFAAQGTRAKAHVVKQAVDGAGNVVYRNDGSPEKVIADEVAADVTYAMQQVMTKGGTGSAAGSKLERPGAGKTGTAAEDDPQNPADSMTISGWFAGFTPQLSAAVDYFREDPAHPLGRADLDGVGSEPKNRFFGANYPARTWTTFMRYALEGQEALEFPKPSYVGEVVNPKPTETPTPRPAQTPTQEPQPQPQGIPVPNVVGQDVAVARAALRALGFDVNVQQQDVTERAQDNKVLSQDPSGGTLEQGKTVTLVVGRFTRGPPGPTPPPTPAVGT